MEQTNEMPNQLTQEQVDEMLKNSNGGSQQQFTEEQLQNMIKGMKKGNSRPAPNGLLSGLMGRL